MSGITAARQLASNGVDVLVLEKSRGVGGRCATRRIQGIPFDHGAQFFTVKDSKFREMTDAWLKNGNVRVWAQGFSQSEQPIVSGGHPRYCALQGMNSLAKILSKGLKIISNIEICSIEKDQASWILRTDDDKVYRAEKVILSAPLPQSLGLLNKSTRNELLQEHPQLHQIEYESCFSMLVLLDGPSAVPEPGALQVDGPIITWIADNTQKLMLSGNSSLTIQTSPAFAKRHFNFSHDEIAQVVLAAAKKWLASNMITCQVQRWRYSKPITFAGVPCITFGEQRDLYLCGDYMQPPSRIEGAFLSGMAVANRLFTNSDQLSS